MKKVKKKKINTRISEQEHAILCQVKIDYQFRSISEILQYLVHCFLKAANGNGTQEEEMPDEIRDMFEGLSEKTEYKQPFVSKHSKKLK